MGEVGAQENLTTKNTKSTKILTGISMDSVGCVGDLFGSGLCEAGVLAEFMKTRDSPCFWGGGYQVLTQRRSRKVEQGDEESHAKSQRRKGEPGKNGGMEEAGVEVWGAAPGAGAPAWLLLPV
jgi:hypothetical protein